MKAQMTSTSLVRVLGAALLVGRGMRLQLAGGTPGERRGGRPASGTAGTTGSGTAGTTGCGGTTATGVAGTTGAAGALGGTTASGVGRQWDGRRGGHRRRRQGVPSAAPQCSDGNDNDGDGKIDYDDPECVGPLDNDESSFATGIPGDNMDACKQDCFFDGNSGAGDDHCDWQLKCDPQSVENKCPYDSSTRRSTRRSARCRRRSRRPASTSAASWSRTAATASAAAWSRAPPTPIRLAATCTAADFGDPAKCPPARR